MAFTSIGAAGTGAGSTSTSTLAVPTTVTLNASTGDFAILTVVTDNIGTTDINDSNEHTSVTGGTGTWTKLGEVRNANGAAAAGVTTSMWLFVPSGDNASNTQFTANFSAACVDKTATLWKYTAGVGNTVSKVGNAVYTSGDATSGFGSATISGLTSKEYLYLRGGGKEANSTSAITPTAGFTAGGLNRSRNSTSAVLVRNEFRINTSTGETSNPTFSISGDYSAIFVAVEETKNGSASGPLSTVTVTSMSGTANNGNGSAAGSLSTTTVTPMAATATGGTYAMRVTRINLRVPIATSVDGNASGSLSTVTVTAIGGSASVTNPAASTLTDNFDDNSRDAAKWTVEGWEANAANVTVNEANGRLEITPPANFADMSFSGYVSANLYDFTGQSVFVSVPQPAGGNNSETYLQVGVNDTNYSFFHSANGNLYFYKAKNDAWTQLSGIAYSASAHRWWRIKHVADTGRILFQAAPSTASNPPVEGDWTTLHDAAHDAGISLTSARIALQAGTWGSTGVTPTAAHFDGFNTATASASNPAASTLTDNFDDNSRDAAKWSEGSWQFAATGVVVAEANDRLEITPPSSIADTRYSGYVSAETFDFTGSSAFVAVPQVPTGGTANAIFAVGKDNQNYYRFVTEAGQLYFQKFVGGTKTNYNNIAHSTTTHRWWRLRQSGDRVYFETAPSTASNPPIESDWTVQINAFDEEIAIPNNSVKISLQAGTYESVASPGTAYFDGFNTTASADSVAGNASGSLSTVTVSSLGASVTTDASITSSLTNVTVSSLSGSAIGFEGLKFDPTKKANNVNIVDDGLAIESTNVADGASRSVFLSAAITGKQYYEFYINEVGPLVTISGGDGTDLRPATSPGFDWESDGSWVINGTNQSNGAAGIAATFTTGDTVMIAVDKDGGKVYLGKNGSWLGTHNPAAGTGGHTVDLSSTRYMGASVVPNSTGALRKVTGRFKASAQSYSAPTGFSAADLYEPNGNATGSLTGVTVTSLSGEASGGASASAALNTVTVTPLSSTQSGNAETSIALTGVNVSTFGVIASADGSANVATTLTTYTSTTFGASVSADASTGGSLQTVTASPLGGAASGGAGAGDELVGVTVTPIEASVDTDASTGGSLQTVTITPLSATLASDANVSSALNDITVTPLSASTSGDASSSVALTGVTVTPLSGSATAETVINADAGGNLTGVTVTPLGSTQSGDASSSGSLEVVTVTPLGASVSGEANATSTLTSVTVTPLTASVSVDVEASGSLQTVTVSNLTATATNSSDISVALTGVTLSTFSVIVTASGTAAVTAELTTYTNTTFGASVTADANTSPALNTTATITPLEASVTGGTGGEATALVGGTVTVTTYGASLLADASTGGSLSSVAATNLDGSAEADGNVTVPLVSIAVTNLEGSVTGTAEVSGSLSTTSITPLEASTSAAGSVQAPLGSTATLTPLEASLQADSDISQPLTNVTVTSLGGGATGTSVGEVTAPLGGTISISNLTANVSGGVSVSGSLNTVSVSGLSGNASASSNASGSLNAVAVQIISGGASGGVNIYGSLQPITVERIEAVSSGGASVTGDISSTTTSTSIEGGVSAGSSLITNISTTILINTMEGFALGRHGKPKRFSGWL